MPPFICNALPSKTAFAIVKSNNWCWQLFNYNYILNIIYYYTAIILIQSKIPFKTCDRTLFFPYCTTGSCIFSILDVLISPYFFRILHYVREVTRWFLLSASKQNKPENVNSSVLLGFLCKTSHKDSCAWPCLAWHSQPIKSAEYNQ